MKRAVATATGHFTGTIDRSAVEKNPVRHTMGFFSAARVSAIAALGVLSDKFAGADLDQIGFNTSLSQRLHIVLERLAKSRFRGLKNVVDQVTHDTLAVQYAHCSILCEWVSTH